MALIIEKQANGKVLVQGGGRQEFWSSDKSVRKSSDNLKAEIVENGVVITTIALSDVISTQLPPAAAVPPPATIDEFVDLLATDFF